MARLVRATHRGTVRAQVARTSRAMTVGGSAMPVAMTVGGRAITVGSQPMPIGSRAMTKRRVQRQIRLLSGVA